MPAAIDHVEIFVPDRHEAAAWYARVLGLEIVKRFETWAQDPRGPLMIGGEGGSMLALFQGPPQGDREPVGIRRVAFRTDAQGFCRFLDRLEHDPISDAAGRRVTRRDVVDHRLSFSIYFRDPYGNRCELTTYDHHAVCEALER